MHDSGGMPSSLSATVSALAVAIGIQEGTRSPVFVIAVVLTCIVMYDASGAKLHAGRQAKKHPLSSARPLHDSLGHTPLQVVAGGLLGCVVAFLMRNSN